MLAAERHVRFQPVGAICVAAPTETAARADSKPSLAGGQGNVLVPTTTGADAQRVTFGLDETVLLVRDLGTGAIQPGAAALATADVGTAHRACECAHARGCHGRPLTRASVRRARTRGPMGCAPEFGAVPFSCTNSVLTGRRERPDVLRDVIDMRLSVDGCLCHRGMGGGGRYAGGGQRRVQVNREPEAGRATRPRRPPWPTGWAACVTRLGMLLDDELVRSWRSVVTDPAPPAPDALPVGADMEIASSFGEMDMRRWSHWPSRSSRRWRTSSSLPSSSRPYREASRNPGRARTGPSRRVVRIGPRP